MSSLNNECGGFVKDYEHGKGNLPASPILNLQILPCDYDRGWTWYLQIGRRNFTGWQPIPNSKPQSSPEKAYANFMEWANKVGIEKFSGAIAEQRNNQKQT